MEETLLEEIITPDENYKYFSLMRHSYRKEVIENNIQLLDISTGMKYLLDKDILEAVLAEFKAEWDLVEGIKPVYKPSTIAHRVEELGGLIFKE